MKDEKIRDEVEIIEYNNENENESIKKEDNSEHPESLVQSFQIS